VFNPRLRNTISVGYYDKVVRVYRLSKLLTNMTKDEERVLREFLDADKKE